MKALIEYFFENENTLDYYPIFMNDLAGIMDNKQIEINEFFEISANKVDRQKEGKQNEHGFCNIEIPLQGPIFSDNQ